MRHYGCLTPEEQIGRVSYRSRSPTLLKVYPEIFLLHEPAKVYKHGDAKINVMSIVESCFL